MIKTNKPFELIYFSVFPTQTVEGMIYTYIAVDDYSTFTFVTGIEHDVTPELLSKHIDILMHHKDFKKPTKSKFTIMIPYDQDVNIESKVLDVIKPFNGELVFNQKEVVKNTLPIINAFNAFKNK
ncbi:MAG: hypothetical protein COA88_09210 [Kordia sp.]|nr:MAG: hypothetical protein COA88_09210 [Kordia sp.]